MIMRPTTLALLSLPLLSAAAAAQLSGYGTDPGSRLPVFGMPIEQDDKPDTYRPLPFQDLTSEIRIELAADQLYDFDTGEVRKRAADYLQQAANLIFEHAKGPVRIECRSDRTPPAAAQKLAERCALALSHWLTVEEKLTKVKFLTVGSSVPPPAAADPKDPFAPAPVNRRTITIVFAKQ
jgi:hypothetical protein